MHGVFLTLCVMAVAVAGVAAGALAPPERSYKILMLLPVSSKSHRNVFMPLAEALADRGHEVVMLTNHPKASKHPNIHEVTHGLPFFREDEINMFELRNTSFGTGKMFLSALPNIARHMYQVPAVKELYLKRKEFDLIVLNNFFNKISTQFPELPPLLDLERNTSLALINTHFSIGILLPLLPSQVEVGGMHCRPASPLPQDLDTWIMGSKSAGVIYFSLGSFTRSISMPAQYRHLFVQAFRRLPQRVIWKYEGEMEDVPDNVMISEWLPQQDILAHHNVKVFITHGGLLSLQEAIYHATPLLTLPLFADQPLNAKFVRNSGLGRSLVWEELTVDMIVDALTDIINDPKYKENVMRMSVRMRDQPTSPRDRAVFWTEYVIRHRGAPQLRSPAAQLSWVEFLMLDVLLLLLLALFLLLFILRRIFRIVTAKVFGGDGRKK